MLGLSFMFALIALAGYSFYKIKQAEEKELEIFEIMYRKNLIDEKSYISLYNSLENEKNADNWAINWVKNNKKLAIMLDKQLN